MESFRRALVRAKYPEDISGSVARICADEFAALYPAKDSYYVRAGRIRNLEILEAFTGSNLVDLAERYGLSVRRIRQILAATRRRA